MVKYAQAFFMQWDIKMYVLDYLIKKINFVLADPVAEVYPLPSDRYDLIASNAVLEHVANVENYFREVGRLLKKGGLSYGLIHNYYSISGGHNLECAYPDSKPSQRVPPWDHLRANKYPTHIYLNKLKPADYKGIATWSERRKAKALREARKREYKREAARAYQDWSLIPSHRLIVSLLPLPEQTRSA